jgi:hypothetical protein
MLFRRCDTRQSGIFNFERNFIMKKTYAATIALALSTLVAGQAMAAYTSPAGKTREQVRAELTEAQRTGDIVADKAYYNETNVGSGRKLNELFPSQYPAKTSLPGKTREQVRAELIAAQAAGEIVADKSYADETSIGAGRKLNELLPNRYPAKAVATGKSRAQVRAELAEAQRTPAPANYAQYW